MIDTVKSLLDRGNDDDPALVTDDGRVLDYAALRKQIDQLHRELSALGVGHQDRVALVLPNGPAAALMFLAAASAAGAAPLNPKYRKTEYEFYLGDLKPKLLVVAEETPAIEAASELDIPVVTLAGIAGTMTLGIEPAAAAHSRPSAQHAGLFLHTSGTTSRPKVVPIAQRNLSHSAHNIAQSLGLDSTDRSLNVMPLFHIHGLMAGLLAPLSAGASVATTAGFDAFKFFGQLETFSPTYYTAVPTMHQMIIDRANRRDGTLTDTGLRFIRSSSASLPAPVLEQLETIFEAPVIEAYGMTEATHQMCANPLPPGTRKTRSVGPATGIELAILDHDALPVDAGTHGQVAIKGPTIVEAYQDNPEANREAFVGGWFLTGDQGYLDEDGYLFLTGRLKELVNRGGEKISPLEVDEALLRHEAVAQAVTFAVPHKKLGEDVAAGVVLQEGAEVSERELRGFLSESLAAFKVPRKVVFLEELPKGATGKLQRIGLAERLDIGPW